MAFLVGLAAAAGALRAEPAPVVEVANVPAANVPAEPAADPSLGGRENGAATPDEAASGGRVAGTTASDGDAVTIVLGGDLGLGGSNQPVLSSGALRHGKRTGWTELAAGIAPLLDGDVTFANLETVVTDRNDLRSKPKAFSFKSHPAGVRHLVEQGFNVFSLANNHALDYGEAGALETLRNMEALEARGLAAWPGVGRTREEASRPADLTVKGARVRVSAIGIGGNGMADREAGGARQRAGMLSYHRAEDFEETVGRLAEAAGDLRILSVHYGAELQVRASRSDVAKLRDDAARTAGIDIVVAHHAHVPAGLQMVDGSLVLYGLGNLLHPGMQDMARFGLCRDYGLVVRVHAAREAGRLVLRAVEAIPLTAMHAGARPLGGEAGRQRIAVLNHLAADLDAPSAGASGLRLAPRADGSGLACLPGADRALGSIGALCAGWEPPPPPPRELTRRIAAAGGGAAVARRDGPDGATRGGRPERARVSRHRSDPASGGGSLLSGMFGW